MGSGRGNWPRDGGAAKQCKAVTLKVTPGSSTPTPHNTRTARSTQANPAEPFSAEPHRSAPTSPTPAAPVLATAISRLGRCERLTGLLFPLLSPLSIFSMDQSEKTFCIISKITSPSNPNRPTAQLIQQRQCIQPTVDRALPLALVTSTVLSAPQAQPILAVLQMKPMCGWASVLQ